jgi:hypothetical protein
VLEYTPTEFGKFAAAITKAGGVAAIILGTAMAGGLVAASVIAGSSSSNWSALGTASCFGLWALMIGWMVGLGLMNAYPTIWITDQALVISAFLRSRVSISWEDVIDVGAGRVPFGHTLVRARRITLFHRWYGWMYSYSLHPSFVVARWIQGRDELLREIRHRSRQAQLTRGRLEE